MKKLKRIIAVTLLLFVASIQFVNAQSRESEMQRFFSSDSNLPYRVICRLAHPTNTFKGGSCSVYGDNVEITIRGEGWFGDIYRLKIRLHQSGNRFDELNVISDEDPISPFMLSEVAKNYANDIYRDYHSDTIAMIEYVYGQRLRDMNARQMCLAVLTLLFWSY